MNTIDDKRFFCIRGYMKSGTNWVCRLLNLHPDIFCTGEYHWEHFFKAYQKMMDTYVTLERSEKHDPIIRKNMEASIRKSMIEMSPPSARVIGDRTPHTIHPVVIRKAHHIAITRDCRDIVVSKMFHYHNVPRVFGFFNRFPKMREIRETFKKDPWLFQKNPELLLSNEHFVRETARQWVEYQVADRNTKANHPDLPVRLVKYEDIHADVEGQLSSMFEFLELDPGLAKEIPEALTPGIKKESPDQFYRKGAVGDWRNYMTKQARQWINEEAGNELLRQEYITSLNWDISMPTAKAA